MSRLLPVGLEFDSYTITILFVIAIGVTKIEQIYDIHFFFHVIKYIYIYKTMRKLMDKVHLKVELKKVAPLYKTSI